MPTKKDKDKQSETDVAFSRPKRGTRRASEYDSDQKASPTGVADIVTPDLAPKPNIGKTSLRSSSPVPETVFSSENFPTGSSLSF